MSEAVSTSCTCGPCIPSIYGSTTSSTCPYHRPQNRAQTNTDLREDPSRSRLTSIPGGCFPINHHSCNRWEIKYISSKMLLLTTLTLRGFTLFHVLAPPPLFFLNLGTNGSTWSDGVEELSKSPSPLFEINWFRVVLDEVTIFSRPHRPGDL